MGWKSWVKSSWIGKSNILGDFTLVDQTKIRTHPRLKLQTAQGQKFHIKKDFADKRVFIENEAGVTTAEISYDKLIPPQNDYDPAQIPRNALPRGCCTIRFRLIIRY